MALKSFYVKGDFSGRTTPVAGGPKISNKNSSMNVSVFQCDSGEEVEIVKVESKQEKRKLISKVTLNIPGEGEKNFEIETRY